MRRGSSLLGYVRRGAGRRSGGDAIVAQSADEVQLDDAEPNKRDVLMFGVHRDRRQPGDLRLCVSVSVTSRRLHVALRWPANSATFLFYSKKKRTYLHVI